MKKETDLLERIAALEKEVSDLRSEIRHIRQHVKFEVNKPQYNIPTPTATQPKLEKATQIAAIEPTTPKKEKRSLEETFIRTLPKIFMVIFVLGVLWGLKLVSDYGFLSDGIKIVGGFTLSIVLGIWAWLMEKKQLGSRIVALSLYGGTFIIGILTTAAGAILYDVLGLYVALVIALLYIVYGVLISYLKGNEALTVLVVFTSLLLPYLLEYMKFDAIIIGIFVVLLFIIVQIVILKHKQFKALFIGKIFSIVALWIVSTFHLAQIEFFVFALVLLYSVFLISFLRLYEKESKRNVSILFSLTIVVLVALNSMLPVNEAITSVALFIMLGILCLVTYLVVSRKQKMLLDIVATLSVLTLLNFIAQLDISRDVTLFLIIAVTFAGLMLALKHAISLMSWIYSAIFILLGLFVFIFKDVQPILSIEHLTHLVIIIMLILLTRKLSHAKVIAHKKSKTIFWQENGMPVMIYLAVLIYIWKIDLAYLPQNFTSYLFYTGIVITFAIVLVLKPEVVGRFLPIIASTVYSIAALILFSSVWVIDQAIVTALIIRLLYIGLFWAILIDIWKHGIIYKNYSSVFEQKTENMTIAGIIVSIFVLFSITNFLDFHVLISWNTAVIFNTAAIFLASCMALYLAAKRGYRNLRLTGIGLLFFGIVKMIFFDLSALDILIRSISFIIIGAIGLVVSNKLLAKGKKETS